MQCSTFANGSIYDTFSFPRRKSTLFLIIFIELFSIFCITVSPGSLSILYYDYCFGASRHVYLIVGSISVNLFFYAQASSSFHPSLVISNSSSALSVTPLPKCPFHLLLSSRLYDRSPSFSLLFLQKDFSCLFSLSLKPGLGTRSIFYRVQVKSKFIKFFRVQKIK